MGGTGRTGTTGGGAVGINTVGTPASCTSGFTQCVIVLSVSRKSTMLITYWLSCASSSAVSIAKGGSTDFRS